MTELLVRMVLFLPAVFLVMVVYSAPLAPDAGGVVRIAVRKSVKVVIWTVVMVVVMQLLHVMFLPDGPAPVGQG